MIHDPEFSEAAYQSLIESIFIDDFRNDIHFDIDFYSGVEERSRGYDIEIGTFIPIFLQVKTSYFKQFPYRGELKIRREQFKYRDMNGAYFFKLHIDDKTKDYMQHNLLCKLGKNGSYARYIAPLFRSRKVLKDLKYSLPSVSWQRPYEHGLFDRHTFHEWQNHFSLMHSIMILPHREATKVAGEHHKYFFNRRSEISFHSEPEQLSNTNALFLRDFIREINETVASEQRERFDMNRVMQLIIDAIERTVEDEIGYEINVLQTVAENDVRENSLEISSFHGLERNFRNFRLLCKYLEVRHNIKTMLVSANAAFHADYI